MRNVTLTMFDPPHTSCRLRNVRPMSAEYNAPAIFPVDRYGLAKRFTMPDTNTILSSSSGILPCSTILRGGPNGNILAGPDFQAGRQCRASGLRRHSPTALPIVRSTRITIRLAYRAAGVPRLRPLACQLRLLYAGDFIISITPLKRNIRHIYHESPGTDHADKLRRDHNTLCHQTLPMT